MTREGGYKSVETWGGKISNEVLKQIRNAVCTRLLVLFNRVDDYSNQGWNQESSEEKKHPDADSDQVKTISAEERNRKRNQNREHSDHNQGLLSFDSIVASKLLYDDATNDDS